MRDRKRLKNRPEHKLQQLAVENCQLLERNPQFLTESQMTSLKASIERDGFVVPILVRPSSRGRYEIISGNHRFLAAQQLGYATIPAVVARLADQDAKRLAVNLNLIHGEPQAEQLAPFLADLTDDVLAQIHLEGELLADVLEFDQMLSDRLTELAGVSGLDTESVLTSTRTCKCPKCGKSHIA